MTNGSTTSHDDLAAVARVPAQPPVSIVLTSKNRQADLLRAIESCLAQAYPDVEVLLYDASTDDTEAVVRRRFPEVRYCRDVPSRGLVAARNQGLREARGKYVFLLDDDAYYTDPLTLAQAVEQFEADATIAAMALPYIDPPNEDRAQPLPFGPGDQLRSFIGCANALRREATLAVGGFNETLFRWHEERDLCIRLMDRGGRVVYGRSGPIVHLPDSRRDSAHLNYYSVRNHFLFDYWYTPHPYLVPRLMIDAAQVALHPTRWSARLARWAFLLAAPFIVMRYALRRRPVSRATYLRFRSLPNPGFMPAGDPRNLPAPLTRTPASPGPA